MSDPELGVQTTVTPEGTQVVHLLNYSYDKAADAVAPVQEITVTVPRRVEAVKAYALTGTVETELRQKEGSTEICLKNMPVYAALELI